MLSTILNKIENFFESVYIVRNHKRIVDKCLNDDLRDDCGCKVVPRKNNINICQERLDISTPTVWIYPLYKHGKDFANDPDYPEFPKNIKGKIFCLRLGTGSNVQFDFKEGNLMCDD